MKNLNWKKKRKWKKDKDRVSFYIETLFQLNESQVALDNNAGTTYRLVFVPGNGALCSTASHGMEEAKQETCGQRFIANWASLMGFCVCRHLLVWGDVTSFEPPVTNGASSCQVTWVCGCTVTWVRLHFQSFPDEKIKARPPGFPVTLQLVHTAATSGKIKNPNWWGDRKRRSWWIFLISRNEDGPLLISCGTCIEISQIEWICN